MKIRKDEKSFFWIRMACFVLAGLMILGTAYLAILSLL